MASFNEATSRLRRSPAHSWTSHQDLSAQALARAVHEAEHLRLLDMAQMEQVLATANGRRGTRKLEAALQERDPGPTRSPLEAAFADLLARSDLPRPRQNVHVHTTQRLVEVDVLWPDQKVVAELDGAAHRTARAFQSDRARDRALAAEGHVVVRLTWHQVTREPERVLQDLRKLLRVRGWRG
jgi:very-short-patch-repair endonuclease